MKQQNDTEPYADINITPMLDLAYVLLIIFIIMTTAAVQGIKVDLPKASSAPSLDNTKTAAITVTDSGQIFLDAKPVSMSTLKLDLQQRKAQNPDLPVIVRGDGKTQYTHIMAVIDLTKQLSITKLGLATDKVTR